MTRQKRRELPRQLEEAERGRLSRVSLKRLEPMEALSRATGLPRTTNSSRALLPHGSWAMVLTAPLFYKEVLVNVCPHCEIAARPGPLRLILSKGGIRPVLVNTFNSYSDEFLSLLKPGNYISRDAMQKVTPLARCDDHKSGLCQNCVRAALNVDQFPAESQEILRSHIVPGFAELPIWAAQPLFHEYMRYLGAAKGDLTSLVNRTQTSLAVNRALILGATPQLETQTESFDSSKIPLLADHLSITYHDSIPPEQYVEATRPFWGTLAGLAEKGGLAETLAVCNQVNDAIDRMSSGYRNTIYTQLFARDKGQLLSIALASSAGALFGPAGGATCGAALLGARIGGERLLSADTQSKLLAKYFGEHLVAVQVWQIQKGLRSR